MQSAGAPGRMREREKARIKNGVLFFRFLYRGKNVGKGRDREENLESKFADLWREEEMEWEREIKCE